MTAREQSLVVLLAVLALVALLVAVAAIVFAVFRTHQDRARIGRLDAKVRSLCARQTVSRVQIGAAGRISVHTQRGC